MANRDATQGALIADALKQAPHTYLEMFSLGVSTSPWKRVDEWLTHNPEWRLVKAKRYMGEGEYLTTWAIERKRVEAPSVVPSKHIWRPTLSGG